MKVVILCGGQGTRLREETEYRPKPMVPVGNNPIIWHIMKTYSHYGFKEFILCLGYKGEIIKDYFRNYHWMTSDVTLQLGSQPNVEFHGHHDEEDWRVTLCDTGQETMTGSRIKKIRKYIGEDKHFFVTYGDGVGDIDIRKLHDFHQNHGKVLTVSAVHVPGRFGEIDLAQDGHVRRFREKPRVTGGRISGGYFVASRAIFDYIDDGTDVVFEQQPLRRVVEKGELMAYSHDGFWQPMDTYAEYLYLNKLWDSGQAPWKVW